MGIAMLPTLVAVVMCLLAGPGQAEDGTDQPIPLAGPFSADGKQSWLCVVPADWPSDDARGEASELLLFEDGRPLGPAHALHRDIRRLGGGRYSHWKGTLFFSSSDGSDPNTNGRAYSLGREPPKPPGQDVWAVRSPHDPFSAFGPDGPPAPPPRKPLTTAPRLVYWYTIDALRADTAAERLDDGPLMPQLDAFRAEAVSFETAYAPSSFTKTSTASMFTGLSPARHGVLHGVVPSWPDGALLAFDLDRRFVTLAEVMASFGYTTITHPYSVHVRPGDGMLQGFSRCDLATERDTALDALPARAFVYEHILGLHAPYDPSADARRRLALPPRIAGAGTAGQGSAGTGSAGEAIDPASSDWFGRPLDGAQLAALRDAYRAEGIDADAHLGRRLAWLKSSGLWDEALVIVTADHGEEFGEHGATQHSVQLYEEVVAVPLLVKFPKAHPLAARHGQRLPHRVGLVDLLPTLLELVAGDLDSVPYELDGRSLVPILTGDELPDPPREILLRTSFTVSLEDGGGTALMVTDAVLSGQHKALLGYRIQSSQCEAPGDAGSQGPGGSSANDPGGSFRPYRQGDWIGELYELSSDGGERHDLAGQRGALLQRLAETFAASLSPLRPVAPRSFDAGSFDAGSLDAGSPDASDAETLQRLRALGYVR